MKDDGQTAVARAKGPKRGTVLLFHGWAQNSKVIQLRSKTLTNKLTRAGYDCLFLQAPLQLPMTSTIQIGGQPVIVTNGGRKNARAWFLYNKEDPGDASPALSGNFIEYVGLEESLHVLETVLGTLSKNDNDVICVLGYSQGAVLAHIVASKCAQCVSPFDEINKFILVSGFPATPRQLQPMNGCTRNPLEGINIPSLHLIGLKDTSVPPTISYNLQQCFVEAGKLEHEKGHLLPQQSAHCARMIEFLNDD